MVLKLINNSSIYKPIRIRQLGHMCVFSLMKYQTHELDKMSNPAVGEFILI